MGNMGRYDPTEIHNKNVLKNFQKEAFVKLACYLILFFVYLYRYVGDHALRLSLQTF